MLRLEAMKQMCRLALIKSPNLPICSSLPVRMHCACVFLVLSALLVLIPAQYTSKYDNVDVDKILKNDRVLTNYIKCLMEEGPCTPEGRELKKTLPDALASACSKCNDKQKSTTEKVIRHLQTRRAKDWDRLSKKYDPEGVYKQKYEAELKTDKTA